MSDYKAMTVAGRWDKTGAAANRAAAMADAYEWLLTIDPKTPRRRAMLNEAKAALARFGARGAE